MEPGREAIRGTCTLFTWGRERDGESKSAHQRCGKRRHGVIYSHAGWWLNRGRGGLLPIIWNAAAGATARKMRDSWGGIPGRGDAADGHVAGSERKR